MIYYTYQVLINRVMPIDYRESFKALRVVVAIAWQGLFFPWQTSPASRVILWGMKTSENQQRISTN